MTILLGVILLASCGNETVEDPMVSDAEKEDSYEILNEQEHNIELYDDENLNITLNKSRHERDGIQDWMKLEFKIINKTTKTFEFYFEKMQLNNDDYGITNVSSTDNEIKPNDELIVIAVVDSLEEIKFDEFIGGQLVYNDYEKNRSVAEFSTYINE